MILKGIPFLIKREGSLSKYILFTSFKLDNNEIILEDKCSFKRYINYLKSYIIYFETYAIEDYSEKECWIVFDGFEVSSKNLYEDAAKDGSSILPILLDYIKQIINPDFSLSEDVEKVNKKDLYFHSVYLRGIFTNKSEEDVVKGLGELKQLEKIMYTCDYINYDIKGFSDSIINGIIKYIGIEEYIKYIFNNLTCISLKSNRNLVGSITDYNRQIEEEFLKRGFSTKESYVSLGKEIDYVLQEDNFNFNRKNLIEILINNPFSFSLIFENINSIIPIYFMEVLLNFVIKELTNLTGNEKLELEYVDLLHKVYLFYVFKTLQNGRSIPDTTSLGKIVHSEIQLVAGSSLLTTEDIVESLRYIVNVRKFMLNAEGDFIALRSSFNTNINILPSIIKSYSSTFTFELQLKDLIKNLEVLCHIEKGNVCLKSNYKLNQFLYNFINKTTKKPFNNKYDFLLDVMTEFTTDQVSAMVNLIYKNVLVLSGRPGTGKTYTITKFVSNIIGKIKEGETPLFLMLSFTNKAVNKLNEYIMNNLYSDRDIEELLRNQTDEKNKIKLLNNHKNLWVSTIDLFVWEVLSSQNKNLISKLEKADRLFIIIDEIGMVALDKFNLLISTLINLYTEKKFYNILEKTVFSGDYAQLISIGIGDFFGDLLTILPMVDLKESVRFGKDKELSKFFETIRQMRFEIKDRQLAKDYLLAIKKIGETEDNVIIHPVDDTLLKGDMYYGTQEDCIDYSYRFIYRLIEDLAQAVLKEDLTLEKFLSSNKDSSSSDKKSFFKNNKEREYTPIFKILEKTKEYDINKVLIDLFIKSSHKFKIITQYRKEESILEEYFISSSARLNKLILFILLGMRFYDTNYNIKTNTDIEIVHSIPEKQYLNTSDDKKIEINDAINHFINIKDMAALKRFISEVNFQKVFLIRDAPYIIKSRRLRKNGLNIGDFIHFKGISKIDGEKYLKFIKYTGSIQDFYDIPLNKLTLRDIDYGWACNVHQLQGDEGLYIIVPFLGALYKNPTAKETVVKRNLKRFDSRALYTAITRVKLSKNEGKLIVYFGKQYLDIIEEAGIILRDTPFRLLIKA